MKTLNEYKIIDKIGTGSQSVVFKSEIDIINQQNISEKKQVAIKIMCSKYSTTNSRNEKLKREYNILSKIKCNENIIQVFKLFLDQPTGEILSLLTDDEKK